VFFGSTGLSADLTVLRDPNLLLLGVLSQTLFSIIITMAILTTMAMPPMPRSALARLPFTREEKEDWSGRIRGERLFCQSGTAAARGRRKPQCQIRVAS
jgi:hypothetical protein